TQVTMNKALILLIMVLGIRVAQCQTLSIGDRLPDEIIRQSKTIRSGIHKLTLLDFWSHGCGSCVESFPKLNNLSELFGNDLNIVFVNHESKDSTEHFLTMRKWIEKPRTEMISGDKVIRNYFSFTGVPFVVWLDKDLYIRAMTPGMSVTEHNIRTYVKTGEIEAETYRPTEYLKSYFDKKFEDKLLSFGYLAEATWYVNLVKARDPNGIKTDILLSKQGIRDLFRYAYEENGKYQLNQPWHVRIVAPDPMSMPKGTNINEDVLYDYMLKLPERHRQNRYRRMKDDLEGYFSVRSYIDTVLVETAVLMSTDKGASLQSRGGKAINTFRSSSSRTLRRAVVTGEERKLVNQPYSRLTNAIGNLMEKRMEMPFVDEVGFKGNVDVTFSYLVFDFFTLDILQEALAQYNLVLDFQLRPTPVLFLE